MPLNSNIKVIVSPVVTNPELIHQSKELEYALSSGQYYDFCTAKAEAASDEHDKQVWNCISTYFGNDVSKDLLQLLGFNLEEMNKKLNQHIPQKELDNLSEGVSKLNTVSFFFFI